mmetsp:Transcript_19916/g.43268  ORF Transcript_19916/g.43268 Transcript_19916/m.43268 type:complete len:474 (+) Transcript_19916:641-2062(+)
MPSGIVTRTSSHEDHIYGSGTEGKYLDYPREPGAHHFGELEQQQINHQPQHLNSYSDRRGHQYQAQHRYQDCYNQHSARHLPVEPTAPPPEWLRHHGGMQSEGRGCAVNAPPPQCVIFTPVVLLACFLIFLLELQENARQNDFSEGPTDLCHYRFTVADVHFCAAHMKVNPMFGPSSGTLLALGAVAGDRIAKENEGWRLLSGMWLHAGLVHCAINMASMLAIAWQLERRHGPLRIGFIYLSSGVFGSIASALFAPQSLSVGASGALFGLLAALVVDILLNWTLHDSPCRALVIICLLATGQFLIGTMPWLDNFAHVFGFLMGFLMAIATLRCFSKGSTCFRTCTRRCTRIAAISIALILMGASLAILYGIGGVDVDDLCPGCRQISCKEFPWGCQGDECWWTCDNDDVEKDTESGSCAGTAAWPVGGGNVGSVALTCPPDYSGERKQVQLSAVDLTQWGQDLLRTLCTANCN